MATTWTVESASEPLVTTRFADALHAYENAPEPKRLLRNGRPLRIQTTPDQLDLFKETA